jgi:hypothetical protein
VILVAPDGAPIGENPVFVPGTNLVAVDVVQLSIQCCDLNQEYFKEVYLISDEAERSTFEYHVNLYADYVPLIEATGSLQDLTSPLRSYEIGWVVQVQSFGIPEPGTGSLLALGFAVLAAGYRMRLGGRASPGRG